MKVVVFDTETNGLPKERFSSYSESEKWPHIVQLSYVVFDTDTNKVCRTEDDIIRIDDSVDLPQECVDIHRITRDMTRTTGIDIRIALEKFKQVISNTDCVVGHNVRFDRDMVCAEAFRCGLGNLFERTDNDKSAECKVRSKLSRIPEYCTMLKGKDVAKIERISKTNGRIYYKNPTLTELHMKLFGSAPEGTHDAVVDVLVCLRCYMNIRHNGVDVCTDSPSVRRLWASQLEHLSDCGRKSNTTT